MFRALEAASLIYKEQKNWDKVMEMVEKAALLYLEHGTPDTAAIALERAGKYVCLNYLCTRDSIHSI